MWEISAPSFQFCSKPKSALKKVKSLKKKKCLPKGSLLTQNAYHGALIFYFFSLSSLPTEQCAIRKWALRSPWRKWGGPATEILLTRPHFLRKLSHLSLWKVLPTGILLPTPLFIFTSTVECYRDQYHQAGHEVEVHPMMKKFLYEDNPLSTKIFTHSGSKTKNHPLLLVTKKTDQKVFVACTF